MTSEEHVYDIDAEIAEEVRVAELDAAVAIDFKKYRTPELVRNIVELINIPSSAFFLIRNVLYVLGFVMSVVGFFSWNLDREWFIGMIIWGVIGGLVTGGLLALARLVFRGLYNISSIVEIFLGTIIHISRDVEEVGDGKSRLPTASELAVGVHEEIMEPCLETAVSEAFWIFGGPIFWAYKISFGRIARYVVRQLKRFDNKDKIRDRQDSVKSYMKGGKTYVQYVKNALEPVHATVEKIGGGFRRIVTFPLYLFSALALAFTLIVFIAARIVAAFA